MLARLRAHLTYANVMATVAVFIALGGSSYAALTITGKNVKNRSLTAKDIRKSSLTTREIKNRSLLARDFRPGQLPAGAQGPKGDKGDKGDLGPSFGDALQVDHVTVPHCGHATLASYSVRVTRPSRIFAAGQAVYRKQGDRPENGGIQIELRNAADTATLAQSQEMDDGSLAEASTDDSMNGLHTSGILMVPPVSGISGTSVYVAPAGAYRLRLIGYASGNCGTTDPTMNQISLSHIVVGNG
jgi:hypothetical protein